MSQELYDDAFERGLHNRRRILGDAWVERSLGNATTFNADFQNMITRFAWHDIWGRPGLDAKTRRIIVLSITLALGRWEEFELHLRAAVAEGAADGLTPDEVKEVLMQGAIYAGVPAANTAFARATPILRAAGHALGAAAPAQSYHPGVGQEGIARNGLHYTVRAPRSGKAPRRTVVLAHALGCDASMWDTLANQLAADCRVICYDQRGHGGSTAPAGPVTMAQLADDAAALLRELDTGPVLWVGLSMGGMVGQELALRHPALVAALVIANATSAYPAAAQAMWQARIDTVRAGGIEAIADAVMARYFHAGFQATHAATVARFRRRLVSTDVAGYLACCAAVAQVDTTARLGQVQAPTLVIAGALDAGTPLAMSETLAAAIPHAQLLVIDGASHLSAIEQPDAFAAAITTFAQAN